MLHYELLFCHSFSLDDPLQIGDAFRYRDGRMLLRPWPSEVPYPETIWGEPPN